MDGQTSGTTEAVESQGQVDPWAAAFAALEPKDEESPAAAADMGNADDGGTAADTEGTGGQGLPDKDETVDGTEAEGDAGGLGADAGEPDLENGTAFSGMLGVTEESIQQFEQDLDTQIRDQSINDIAKEFIKRGVRNKNGKLGASIDDPDVCKRDEDNVPHFFNPETGQEFRGDNPRRQAQEWVDDYNKELARVFNDACEQYEKHLKEESAPQLAVMKFAPKYEKLDDIRRGMFDNVIEDYEIKDNQGKVVGYSCDLDKALALVDRQISMIQNYAKQKQQAQPAQASAPALDMKTSSGAVPSGEQEMPTSLAEAMERLQDAELAKMKR